MLKRPLRQAGVTLVELVIAVAVFAGLLALAVPNAMLWVQNAQIRGAADAIVNGLQTARATAVQRNAVVNLYFTDNLTNGCALSASGPDFVVAMDNPAGSCASAPHESTAPRIVQTRAGRETAKAVLAADQTIIGFNGLGRRVNAGSAANVNINITNTAGGGSCVAAGGEMRCLRVVISASGQVRLCDPAVESGDARSC